MNALIANPSRIRKALGVLILLFSSAVLLWGVWPSQATAINLALRDVSPATGSIGLPRHSRAQPLSRNSPVSLTHSSHGAILEPRRSTLSWVQVARKGDAQVIQLLLNDAQPQAGQDRNPGGIYADYNILAEARLDMAGVEVVPRETISRPMLPGEPVSFFWTARPDNAGKFQGTVWLYFHFVPLGKSAQESQQAISAQTIEIRTVDLLGMGGGTARVAGLWGFLLGLLLVVDLHTFRKVGKRLSFWSGVLRKNLYGK